MATVVAVGDPSMMVRSGHPVAAQASALCQEAEPFLSDHSLKDPEEQILKCVHCAMPLTRHTELLSLDGRVTHTKFNPHGLLFSLRCYAPASGCLARGPLREDFSWFPPFAWRPALCKSCGVHVGWHFVRGEAHFYALICERLRS
jgi:hypothetical protein